MAVSLLLNGERAVVLLFIARVISFSPFSLLYESLSLSLVSLLALYVEISADISPSSLSPFFTTRLGASSGILLGAATLPGLMMSKLVQMSRAISLREISVEEFEYLRFQYWATSATCFGVLVFLFFILQRQHDRTHPVPPNFNWDSIFGLSCMALYAGIFCVSFAEKSEDGRYAALMLFWALCHGLAAVKLILNVLRTFPACASIGEALLVTAGIVVYFGDMLSYTAAEVHGHLTSSKLISAPYGIKRNEISTIIQGLILGLLLFPLCFKFVLRIWEGLTCSAHFGNQELDDKKRSFMFYILLAVILIVAVPSWMQFVQDFHIHPFLWIFNFVFSEPLKRLSICICWVVIIYPSVRCFYDKSKDSKTKRILLRKYYHLLAVLMFLPALIIQPEFLNLALGAALAVFLVLEIIRIWRIWPLGQLVHQFMNAFTDHRDSDLLVVSHFSLLLGCALPIWFSSGFNDRPLAPFAGILSLGIGDTMASMVGHKYGVIRWSKSSKTIEGTAAGITSVLVACSILLPHLATTAYIFSQHWFSLLVAVTASGLLEAFTAQLDNAFIPLVFYSLLCL